MAEPGGEWRDAEREYADTVVGEDTLPEMFEAAVDRYGSAPAQRYKGGAYDRSLAPDPVPRAPDGEFPSLSYGEMGNLVRNLAAGFRDLGVGPDDRVGIYANTRAEWALTDFAVLAAGGVVTTVYTESSRSQVRYLLGDPGATGVVVENAELLADVLAVEDDLALEFVVVLDDVSTDRDDVYTLGEVQDRGSERFDAGTYRDWLDARDTGDLASLIYTSGTTGRPKGVRLTHRNFRANVNQCRKRMGPRPDKGAGVPVLDENARTISLLPLAHVFERLAGHFLMFASGATVGYAENPDTVPEDIVTLQPTHATSVPLVYERIYDAIRERATGFREPILEWALDVAVSYARSESPGAALRLRHAVADAVVYSTVREELGGEIEFMVSGGGSLDADLARAFVGMGVPIVEGYGLTETAPVVSVNPAEDIRPGTMGPPLPDVDVRLDESVVDEEFPSAPGTVGELLVDGPNVTDGYWNQQAETARAFSGDGYFRTGDLVARTDDGYLVYVDRLKELLVLSTGKNVAPVPIEDRFSTSDRVDQAMVVGDGRKFVGALLVPDSGALERWAEREGIDLPRSREAQVRDERVREWVRAAVDEVNAELDRSQRIKQFELVTGEWTAENDMLTPSMKKKRRNIREAHADAIDRIYADR